METARFFTDLRSQLDDARHAYSHAVDQLFYRLAPVLAEAKREEEELDPSEVRRFNALKYLRTDELGLSHIIADLLDPCADHGQRTVFLEELLISLKQLSSFGPADGFDRCQVTVTTEHKITGDRRIDIVVVIFDGRNEYALAIENKPYADDQRHQVRDYLRYLRKRFNENFLLVYLSPTGKGPSPRSVSRQQLLTDWRQHFAILPYDQGRAATEPNELEVFRLPYSLTDWLESCREACEVARLRWFLDETLRFCQRTFGGHTMTSDLEANTIRDFLFRNPEHFDTALAVFDSWTSIRDEVCKRFLERLCARIKAAAALQPYADDMNFVTAYGSEAKSSNCIWLYRDRWTPYSAINTSKLPHTKGRTSIELGNAEKGPSGWYIGVRIPKSADELTFGEGRRRRHLVKRLATTLGPDRHF